MGHSIASSDLFQVLTYRSNGPKHFRHSRMASMHQLGFLFSPIIYTRNKSGGVIINSNFDGCAHSIKRFKQ